MSWLFDPPPRSYFSILPSKTPDTVSGVLRTEYPLDFGRVFVAARFFNTGVGVNGSGAGAARTDELRPTARSRLVVKCMAVGYLMRLGEALLFYNLLSWRCEDAQFILTRDSDRMNCFFYVASW